MRRSGAEGVSQPREVVEALLGLMGASWGPVQLLSSKRCDPIHAPGVMLGHCWQDAWRRAEGLRITCSEAVTVSLPGEAARDPPQGQGVVAGREGGR